MADRNPRIDPSDWASRRKSAMNRARELRSRIKEAEHNSDVASIVSKSEMQRQRRHRQLEATQRLLDGQVNVGGINGSNEISSGRSVGNKAYEYVDEGRRQKKSADDRRDEGRGDRTGREETSSTLGRYNHDEQPVGGRRERKARSNDGSETHSIISKKHLGHIQQRLNLASEFDQYSYTKSSRNSAEDNKYSRSTNETKDEDGGGQISKVRSTSRNVDPPEDTIKHSLRERPIEGRGRGRGRGRSTPGSGGGTSSLGELSRSSKSFARPSALVDDQMSDARSRSPISTQVTKSSSSRQRQSSRANVDESEALQAYLRSRRVPDYKEGECEKLANLRQRLVARRRKREAHGKENAVPESAGETNRGKSRHESAVESEKSSKNMPPSLERLDPNEYTASDFQSKPGKTRHAHHDSLASPPRARRTHETEDERYRYQESNSMDNSRISHSRSERMMGGMNDDDEASVVNIELIQCDCCKRSFAPKVYEKHFDEDGQPKCANNNDKKRPVFNSAKARIANNSNLNADEKVQVLQENKKVTKELTRKLNGKASKRRNKKSDKWREESKSFREAMRTNRLIAKAEQEGKPAHYYL